MRCKFKSLLDGTIIEVHSTTDSPDSSYGLECWVDDEGRSYGQCQFGAPLGYELVEINEERDIIREIRDAIAESRRYNRIVHVDLDIDDQWANTNRLLEAFRIAYDGSFDFVDNGTVIEFWSDDDDDDDDAPFRVHFDIGDA